jgi:hypothetical protein
MPMSFTTRLAHAWNTFFNMDNGRVAVSDLGPSYSMRPDRLNTMITNERSIITSVYTRGILSSSSRVASTASHIRMERSELLS